MSLSAIERNVFIFLNYLYFYLYPFPLQWDTDYIQLTLLKPCSRYLVPFVSVLIYTIGYAITCALTAIYFNSRPNFETIEFIILFLFVYALQTTILLVFPIFRNIHLSLAFLNEIIQMADRIQNGNL